ncbi:hypothetical protein RIF29_22670 [Crotalaria pallida]|uniref:Uncharacterized protein n=1 Tax=Crotalaria pallida TaxID=3830 RepID=A0AAN9F6W5_CROPI
MDTKLKSITLLTLILLASFFSTMLSVSEARPMPLKNGIVREVDGVFRTLKSSGPSPGVGHKNKQLQNLGGMKDSGPSSGVGHKHKNLQNLGGMKDSGPSPGEGHGIKTFQDIGAIKNSGPSPGEGH